MFYSHDGRVIYEIPHLTNLSIRLNLPLWPFHINNSTTTEVFYTAPVQRGSEISPNLPPEQICNPWNAPLNTYLSSTSTTHTTAVNPAEIVPLSWSPAIPAHNYRTTSIQHQISNSVTPLLLPYPPSSIQEPFSSPAAHAQPPLSSFPWRPRCTNISANFEAHLLNHTVPHSSEATLGPEPYEPQTTQPDSIPAYPQPTSPAHPVTRTSKPLAIPIIPTPPQNPDHSTSYHVNHCKLQ